MPVFGPELHALSHLLNVKVDSLWVGKWEFPSKQTIWRWLYKDCKLDGIKGQRFFHNSFTFTKSICCTETMVIKNSPHEILGLRSSISRSKDWLKMQLEMLKYIKRVIPHFVQIWRREHQVNVQRPWVATSKSLYSIIIYFFTEQIQNVNGLSMMTDVCCLRGSTNTNL